MSTYAAWKVLNTREGRLALIGFMDALRDYGDEARAMCPRLQPGSTVFVLRWTFDAGPGIRHLNLHVDDSEGGNGVLRILYAELVLLSDEP